MAMAPRSWPNWASRTTLGFSPVGIASRRESPWRRGLVAEEERSRRLSRVKAAATALAKRHVDGSLPVEYFNIEVEDQRGQIVQLGSETDQRAVMMGLMLTYQKMMRLMLHANGKQLIRSENYKDALEVLTMGEVNGSPVFASGYYI